MLYHPRISTPQQAGAYYARKRNRAAQETALVDDQTAPAWGTITFVPSPLPGNGDTITIHGTVITFGTTVGLSGLVTLAEVLDAVVNYITTHPISGVSVSLSGNGLLVQSTAPADTSIAIAASAATASGSHLTKQQIRVRVPL
jgi:hypothetical protein